MQSHTEHMHAAGTNGLSVLSVHTHEWIRINNPLTTLLHRYTPIHKDNKKQSLMHILPVVIISLSLSHTQTRGTALCAAEITTCHLI